MQNSNMIISIFLFYYQKKGIPSENPFLFRKELCKERHLYIMVTHYDKATAFIKTTCLQLYIKNFSSVLTIYTQDEIRN